MSPSGASMPTRLTFVFFEEVVGVVMLIIVRCPIAIGSLYLCEIAIWDLDWYEMLRSYFRNHILWDVDYIDTSRNRTGVFYDDDFRRYTEEI